MSRFCRYFFLLLLSIFTRGLFAQDSSDLVVASDGSGKFSSIQAAVNSVRDLGEKRVKIFIKNGIYNEKLIIPKWKTNITLAGESASGTIITGNDYSGKPVAGGRDAYGLDKLTTYTSYTVLVQGNGTELKNLTIANTAGRVGQAVALDVQADKVKIEGCRILGNQDTLYTSGADNRQYYLNCYIEGTTDFIFGEATCLFQACTIKSLSNSYITASAQRKGKAFGYVFSDCDLVAAPGVTEVFLGRPWRPYARTVFIKSRLGSHIRPQGWHAWPGDKMFPDKEKTAFYAEFQNSGPGSSTDSRVKWARVLSPKEAKMYTVNNIFAGSDAWRPE